MTLEKMWEQCFTAWHAAPRENEENYAHADCCPMIITRKLAKFALAIKTLLALEAKISPRLIQSLVDELEKD